MKTMLLDLMRDLDTLRIVTELAACMVPRGDTSAELRRFAATIAAENIVLLEALEHEQSDSVFDVVGRIERRCAALRESMAGKYVRMTAWWQQNGEAHLQRVSESAGRIVHILGTEAA